MSSQPGSQNNGLVTNLLRKAVSLFPATWPAKTYNILLAAPFLKGPLSLAIRKMAPREIDLPEGKVMFDPEDPVISGTVGFGQYEPETVACFRASLTSGMNVVDIGANLGYFTVIAAGRVGPSGHVFAYEPDPHNFALLKKNIATNSFGHVTTLPIALSDTAGSRELFFGDNQCTLSFSDKKGAGRSETVETDTLDASLAKLGAPRIDIIKMDIEGAEPIAFAGMQETLARNPTLTILFELYPNSIRRLGHDPLAFLQKIVSLGFTLSAIDEDHRNRASITDLPAYLASFPKKDHTRNLIAVRK